MKVDIKRRVEEIEMLTEDWAADLDFVDYVGLEDYDDGNWKEIFFDDTITVVRNLHTGEIRGIYNDRRTDAEIVAAGGDLAYA